MIFIVAVCSWPELQINQFADTQQLISLRDSLTVYLSAQTKCVDQIDEQDPTGKKVTEVFGAIPCLDEKIEAHDGRIRPVFQ